MPTVKESFFKLGYLYPHTILLKILSRKTFLMFGQYHSIYWALISLIKGCPPLEEFQNINIFGEKCREMPFQDVTKVQIKKWRPAGYHSQRNAAAAMGFLLSHGPRIDLTLLESAWTGVLLLKGRTTVQIT